MGENPKTVTAAILIIGNEILSGRTKDKNLGFLAESLEELGVQVREARVVPDIEEEIVDAVNGLRGRFDYVFTTGGIGPTHDDITADSVARAFGVGIDYHPEAMRIMGAHYQKTGGELNEARKRMARVPDGGELVENPISRAPGFRIENVYVLAGIPVICQAMFQSLKHQLVGGDPMLSVSITGYMPEGLMAPGLEKIQNDYPHVDIGSYPFHRNGRYGSVIVCRSQVEAAVNNAAEEVRELMRQLGDGPADE
jgi:molybdenum cofactor synthesis domain-containing protein